jgi:transcriptional regulator with XRE-family HTH domain
VSWNDITEFASMITPAVARSQGATTQLREHRVRALLSQPQLAERSGVSAKSIENLEQGTYRGGSLSIMRQKMLRIAQALEVEPSQISEFAAYVAPNPQPPLSVPLPLREHRRHAGLSLRKLSQAAGVAPRTILLIELGRTKTVYPRTGQRLADALGVSASQIAEITDRG